MDTFVSDAKAVDIVYSGSHKGTVQALPKGTFVHQEGFFGVLLSDVSVAGDKAAIEICREHEIVIGAVAAAKGDVLYVTANGTITATASGNKPCLKVTRAKNAANAIWAIILPQSVANA